MWRVPGGQLLPLCNQKELCQGHKRVRHQWDKCLGHVGKGKVRSQPQTRCVGVKAQTTDFNGVTLRVREEADESTDSTQTLMKA